MLFRSQAEKPAKKDWFSAVQAYHEHQFSSPVSFLSSARAQEFGLDCADARELRRAIQSVDARWQTAAKTYIHEKFETPKKFVSSGKFLKLGFTPCRDHVEVLRYALKFYKEENQYRENANGYEVTQLGKYGGSSRYMKSPMRTRITHRVVGYDPSVLPGNDIPLLVDVDDSGSENMSRLSGDSSSVVDDQTVCYTVSERFKEIPPFLPPKIDFSCQDVLTDLSNQLENNSAASMLIFFVFAVIPLLVYAQVRSTIAIVSSRLYPPPPVKPIELPTGVEDEWKVLRAHALMLDETY